jgi:hypothetical protein
MKRPLWTAAAAALLATACVQAQEGPTTTFDGLAGSRTVDTDGNVEMNGAAITLRGRVGGWVMMNGASVDVDADIGGDLEANGGSVEIRGSVGGDSEANGGAVSLTGEFAGDVYVNGGAIAFRGGFASGFRANGGSIDFEGRAYAPVDIAGSGRNRTWFGRERADRSEVRINGELAAGGRICAHEVSFGRGAELGARVTVIADESPRYRDGFDDSLVDYQPRNGERCDEV